MSTVLCVEPLPLDVKETDVEQFFGRAGTVVNCDVLANASTRISKVFALVEMASNRQAEKAIAQLDGKMLSGRTVRVVQAPFPSR